jgi:hypothetical protein
MPRTRGMLPACGEPELGKIRDGTRLPEALQARGPGELP